MTELRPSHYVGSCGIVVRDGMLLLGLRKGSAGAGEWGLPGGHLEHGERLDECILRELTEETGMTATHAIFASVVNDPKQPTDKNYINFALELHGVTGVPTVCEPEHCAAWQWFPLNELPTNVFYGHRDVIRLFIERQPFAEIKTQP
jgi:8-oxo-dGTP diphosphatase